LIKVPEFKDKSDRTITICYQKKTILIVMKVNRRRGDAIEKKKKRRKKSMTCFSSGN